MKKLFSKIFVAIFIFTISFSSFSIQAKEPLYEKYMYNENFEYNDEMIGHALKATVPKIMLEYRARIKYKPMELDVDALASKIEVWYEQLYEKGYSEDEISEKLLEKITSKIPYYTSYGSYKEEVAEGQGHGSGVVISEDGYIATNAHVASLDEESKLMLYMNSLSSTVYEDLDVMLKDAARYDITFTEEDIQYLHELLLQKSCKKVRVIDEETVLNVCFASHDGDTSLDNATVYEAELVEIGTQEGIDGLTQDTAILKIDAENLIALPLSDSYPEANSQIVSAGYPAIAEEIFEKSGSSASSLSVSIGTGKIARIVPIDNSDYKAMEISTTISSGNSGGPSVDKHLQIEGLNTYAAATDYRFAYMISSEFIKHLTDDIDLEIGDTSKTFFTGLQMLQQNYGPAAEECMEEVKNSQKNTPYIDHLINIAQDAPDNEFALTRAQASYFNLVYIAIIGAGIILLIIIIVAIILACKSRKKKTMPATTESYSCSYVPPTSAPTAMPMTDDTLSYRADIPDSPQAQDAPPMQDSFQNQMPIQNSDNFSLGETIYSEIAPEEETLSTPVPEQSIPQPDAPVKSRLKSTMKTSSTEQNS